MSANTPQPVCGLWFRGPRGDVLDSVPVNHVCMRDRWHEPPCACCCGVIDDRR